MRSYCTKNDFGVTTMASKHKRRKIHGFLKIEGRHWNEKNYDLTRRQVSKMTRRRAKREIANT